MKKEKVNREFRPYAKMEDLEKKLLAAALASSMLDASADTGGCGVNHPVRPGVTRMGNRLRERVPALRACEPSHTILGSRCGYFDGHAVRVAPASTTCAGADEPLGFGRVRIHLISRGDSPLFTLGEHQLRINKEKGADQKTQRS